MLLMASKGIDLKEEYKDLVAIPNLIYWILLLYMLLAKDIPVNLMALSILAITVIGNVIKMKYKGKPNILMRWNILDSLSCLILLIISLFILYPIS